MKLSIIIPVYNSSSIILKLVKNIKEEILKIQKISSYQIILVNDCSGDNSWNEISKIGNKVTNFWKTISKKYDLPVSIQGIPALANYSFKDKKNNSLYRSYLINQLLDKNFLSKEHSRT